MRRKGRKTWRKLGKMPHPRAIRRNEREDGHGRMKEDEGREQEMRMMMMVMMMTTTTETIIM